MGRRSQARNQASQSEDTNDVFVRLRQRAEEMHGEDRGPIDPAVLAKKLSDRARMLRGRAGKDTATGPQISFLAFCHGAQRYGILVSDIVEVQPLKTYTPAPRAPEFIPGVVHWRGTILSLVDLAKLFGIAETGLIDERTYVIVEAAGHRLGILAGEVEELCTVPLDQLKSVPELPTKAPPEWVVGICDENRLILLVERIVEDEKLTKWKDAIL